MQFDTIKTILEFIQITCWPLVIFILFSYFCSPLKKLLYCFIEAVNRGGIKFTTSGIEIPSLQENTETISDFIKEPRYYKSMVNLNQPESIDNPLSVQTDDASEVLTKHEKSLVRDLLPLINEFLSEKKSTQEQNDLLRGLLCDVYISLYFERSYQRILGSQLQLLIRLEDNPKGVASEQEGKEVFKTRSSVDESYEKWISYLEKTNFVTFEKNVISLTEAGREFLQYIHERSYSIKKAG